MTYLSITLYMQICKHSKYIHGSRCLEGVEQSLRNPADRAEGGAVWERLYEVFAFLYTGAEQRIQGHGT